MTITKRTAKIESNSVDGPVVAALERPFAEATDERSAARDAAAANVYGLCSIQDFSGSLGNHDSDLSNTHADARGFLEYLQNFYAPNYWLGDGAVKTWLYEEPYDHWQNLYGVDAVLAFYHSGHGSMTGAGVFEAPTGGNWSGETWIESNHDMLLANQVSRYIFWSTCLSCRVSDGITPVTTWAGDDNNPGFRMLFGFETTSVDSGDYGSNLWRHWQNNEPLSTSWLNASWDIDTSQSPSCVASGSDADDAANRLFNERMLDWGAVSRDWYSWRWYAAAARSARNRAVPRDLAIAQLDVDTFTPEHVQAIATRHELAAGPAMNRHGVYSVRADGRSVSLDGRGHLHARLARINHRNKNQIDSKRAMALAEDVVKRYQLDAGEKVQFDVLRLGKTAAGAARKGSKVEPEYVTDTTVQFRQVINGVPTVSADAGVIRVTIDNDATVTHLHSSVKKVSRLHAKPPSEVLAPSGDSMPTRSAAAGDVEESFRKKLSRFSKVRLVGGGHEIGYDVSAGYGRLVAQRVYEATMTSGLKKRVRLAFPLTV